MWLAHGNEQGRDLKFLRVSPEGEWKPTLTLAIEREGRQLLGFFSAKASADEEARKSKWESAKRDQVCLIRKEGGEMRLVGVRGFWGRYRAGILDVLQLLKDSDYPQQFEALPPPPPQQKAHALTEKDRAWLPTLVNDLVHQALLRAANAAGGTPGAPKEKKKKNGGPGPVKTGASVGGAGGSRGKGRPTEAAAPSAFGFGGDDEFGFGF